MLPGSVAGGHCRLLLAGLRLVPCRLGLDVGLDDGLAAELADERGELGPARGVGAVGAFGPFRSFFDLSAGSMRW